MALKKSGNLMMVADSFYKREYDDEAHFFCKSAQMIGVADGGGWRRWRFGGGGGDFARVLMRKAEYAAMEYSSPNDVDPIKVIKEAYLNTILNSWKPKGSSTACLISLSGHTLRAANVGNGGFLVMRAGKTFYTSPLKQFRFDQLLSYKNTSLDQVEELAVEVESGDIIIAGTCGLFDNLFPEDIERIVNNYRSDCWDSLSNTLAMAAHQRSKDKTAVRPFEVAASETGEYIDDITVVVAHLVHDS